MMSSSAVDPIGQKVMLEKKHSKSGSDVMIQVRKSSRKRTTMKRIEDQTPDDDNYVETMLKRIDKAKYNPDPALLRAIEENHLHINLHRLEFHPEKHRDHNLARILRDTGLSGLPLAQRTIKELEEESIEVNTLMPHVLCLNDKDAREIFASVRHLVVAADESTRSRKEEPGKHQKNRMLFSIFGEKPGPTKSKSRLSTLLIRKRVVLKNGKINTRPIRIMNESSHYFSDLFTTLVDAKWRWTLLAFTCSFFLSWLFFAAIWFGIAYLHEDLAIGDRPEEFVPCVVGITSFSTAFLFSVETQHTIGYGTRAPTEQCTIAALTVCIQSIVGMMIQAFMVGIIFTKLSIPTKRAKTLTFSKCAVICKHDGYLTFMCRVGDMRTSQIIEAHTRAQVIRRRVTAENEILPFEQKEIAIGPDHGEDRLFLIWPQILMHRINKDSPFYFMDARDFQKARFEIVVILEGVVQSTSSTVQARGSYLPHEVFSNPGQGENYFGSVRLGEKAITKIMLDLDRHELPMGVTGGADLKVESTNSLIEKILSAELSLRHSSPTIRALDNSLMESSRLMLEHENVKGILEIMYAWHQKTDREVPRLPFYDSFLDIVVSRSATCAVAELVGLLYFAGMAKKSKLSLTNPLCQLVVQRLEEIIKTTGTLGISDDEMGILCTSLHKMNHILRSTEVGNFMLKYVKQSVADFHSSKLYGVTSCCKLLRHSRVSSDDVCSVISDAIIQRGGTLNVTQLYHLTAVLTNVNYFVPDVFEVIESHLKEILCSTVITGNSEHRRLHSSVLVRPKDIQGILWTAAAVGKSFGRSLTDLIVDYFISMINRDGINSVNRTVYLDAVYCLVMMGFHYEDLERRLINPACVLALKKERKGRLLTKVLTIENAIKLESAHSSFEVSRLVSPADVPFRSVFKDVESRPLLKSLYDTLCAYRKKSNVPQPEYGCVPVFPVPGISSAGLELTFDGSLSGRYLIEVLDDTNTTRPFGTPTGLMKLKLRLAKKSYVSLTVLTEKEIAGDRKQLLQLVLSGSGGYQLHNLAGQGKSDSSDIHLMSSMNSGSYKRGDRSQDFNRHQYDPKKLSFIQRNPRRFVTVFTTVSLLIFFSKPIYDIFIKPLVEDPEERKRRLFRRDHPENFSYPKLRFQAGVGILVRFAFVLYGMYQDAHMLVKYTDVDYKVFTDASRHVVNGRSPFERHTYRYTPLVAWMLVPNILLDPLWGKVIFSLADVACGFFIYVLVKSELLREQKYQNIEWISVKAACLWLYNPLTIVVSTRGSADSIPSLLVLLTLVCLRGRSVKLAGVAFGLAVHFKIYPIIYSLPIFLSLRSNPNRVTWSDFWKWNRTQITFVGLSLLTFAGLFILCYSLYGRVFINEAFLYHVTRRDTRHNFSVYFYLLYITPQIRSLMSVLLFSPQLMILGYTSVAFCSPNKLYLGLFILTAVFVTFNKVVTSQYFLWYLVLIPLIAHKLEMTKAHSAVLFTIWGFAQLSWLMPAYFLEFEGRNVFFYLWVEGLAFLCANVGILSKIINNSKPVTKIDKWDGAAVKNALDDAAKEMFANEFEYAENTKLIDVRLWICFLACVVAGFALGYDYLFPFPASKLVLVSCVSIYFLFMILLTVYTNYCEKNIFCVFEEKDPAGMDPPTKWQLSSFLKRFDDMYTLTIAVLDGPSGKGRESSVTRSVANFFDENGVLVAELFEKEIRKMHDSLNAERKRKGVPFQRDPPANLRIEVSRSGKAKLTWGVVLLCCFWWIFVFILILIASAPQFLRLRRIGLEDAQIITDAQQELLLNSELDTATVDLSIPVRLSNVGPKDNLRTAFLPSFTTGKPVLIARDSFAANAISFKIEPLLDRKAPSLEENAHQVMSMLVQRSVVDVIQRAQAAMKGGASVAASNDCSVAAGTSDGEEFTPCDLDKFVDDNGRLLPYFGFRDCPSVPETLVTERSVNLSSTYSYDRVVLNERLESAGVLPGGEWIPRRCISRHKVAVVIPYRDRATHLVTLLKELHSLLQSQQLHYKIIVVEQAGDELFNKGKLMNAAFLTALRSAWWDCFVFHDVDLIPEDGRNMYSCPQRPRHLSVAVDKLNYTLPYHYLMGGVVAFRTEHFLKLNGYSNLYWGWGGEDDDMGRRVLQTWSTIDRPLKRFGRYKMLPHVKRRSSMPTATQRLLITAGVRRRLDGLNSSNFTLVEKEEVQRAYTRYLINVGRPPEIILKLAEIQRRQDALNRKSWRG
ncbi:unnamed protein product [Notodromas monacha]|uniref:GPI alpha-1,4-mannosyltransferase I, catalytic subunit n=1 Tax=Notodromas monacha TaxID=399045 RepID=A0A7R9GH64_9CRUS|nr:unnamed protein product [Notodromas monacha]CAG0920594.1 unnamed protein product [Notodromas monacha]